MAASHSSRSGQNFEGWCKILRCSKCVPAKVMEMKVSESSNNYGRMYYKCKFCGEFKWVEKTDIISTPYNEGNSSIVAKEDFEAMRTDIKAVGEYFNSAVKIGVIMYLVLLYVVLK